MCDLWPFCDDPKLFRDISLDAFNQVIFMSTNCAIRKFWTYNFEMNYTLTDTLILFEIMDSLTVLRRYRQRILYEVRIPEVADRCQCRYRLPIYLNKNFFIIFNFNLQKWYSLKSKVESRNYYCAWKSNVCIMDIWSLAWCIVLLPDPFLRFQQHDPSFLIYYGWRFAIFDVHTSYSFIVSIFQHQLQQIIWVSFRAVFRLVALYP